MNRSLLTWLCSWSLALAMFLFLAPNGARAVPKLHKPRHAVAAAHSPLSPETWPEGKSLEIEIETSRAHPTVGTGLGVQADIKNVSTRTIYLNEQTTRLVIPPELLSSFGGVTSNPGLFPTHHTWVDDPKKQEPFDGTVELKPGSRYVVEWSNGLSQTDNTDPRQFGPIKTVISIIYSELNFIFFNPGDYKFTVVAQYWTEPGFNPNEYRTATESATVNVGAPQSVIIVGAGIGGLIASFVLPHPLRELRRKTKTFFSKPLSALEWVDPIFSILGSMLLAAIVTILLNRISETQFLIRVTVADFWGAIAIGFIANYIGVRIFERIGAGAIDRRAGRDARDTTGAQKPTSKS